MNVPRLKQNWKLTSNNWTYQYDSKKFSGINWLSSQPHHLAQNAAAKLIKWILGAFVENIVHAFFKATDVSQRNCKKKVFYYRKYVWSKLIGKGIDKLKRNNYVEINADVYKKFQSSKILPNISELRYFF